MELKVLFISNMVGWKCVFVIYQNSAFTICKLQLCDMKISSQLHMIKNGHHPKQV